MRRVTIVLGETNEIIEGDVIGVDLGAYICASQSIPMILACGDFDSVDETQFALIEKRCDAIYRVNPIKDETDFEYALSFAQEYDEILVLGGLGNRRDHEYVNVMLAMKDSRIILKDSVNCIKKYDAGHHIIHSQGYRYCSFIVIADCEITLKGFSYPLDRRAIKVGDTYLTSNEIIAESGELIIKGGSVLCIRT